MVDVILRATNSNIKNAIRKTEEFLLLWTNRLLRGDTGYYSKELKGVLSILFERRFWSPLFWSLRGVCDSFGLSNTPAQRAPERSWAPKFLSLLALIWPYPCLSSPPYELYWKRKTVAFWKLVTKEQVPIIFCDCVLCACCYFQICWVLFVS